MEWEKIIRSEMLPARVARAHGKRGRPVCPGLLSAGDGVGADAGDVSPGVPVFWALGDRHFPSTRGARGKLHVVVLTPRDVELGLGTLEDPLVSEGHGDGRS